MNILSCTGSEDIAIVMTASFGGDTSRLVEFVDARDPDLPRSDKWVVIISTQFGCPIGCIMCDSGHKFLGNVSAAQMFAQIDHAIARRQEGRAVASKKFKIQFARMGEPALNPAVLDVLHKLPKRYDAPGLIPCVATVMPEGTKEWFEKLLYIKRTIYAGRVFQLQVSINTTDLEARERLMPYPKWSFERIASFGRRFIEDGDRKIALNFAWTADAPIDPRVISRHFDPDCFCVKITPLNPTIAASERHLESAFAPHRPASAEALCDEFARLGYDTILSIGDTRENAIGSNCGMSVRKMANDISLSYTDPTP